MNLNLEELNWEDYKSYFFPCNPFDSFREQLLLKKFDPLHPNVIDDKIHHTYCLLRNAIVEDENQLKNLHAANPSDLEGKVININELLFPDFCKGPLIRINGEQVTTESLTGKHIMVCCFFVPQLWNSSARKVSLACHEFYAKMPRTIEVVIVANMRGSWTCDESAFVHFISGFPSSCLFVPFKEKERSYFVCNSIAKMHLPILLLVAPSGEVLFHNEFSSTLLVPHYRGSNSPFPFISHRHHAYSDADIHKHPSSLQQCLCSDYVLRMRKKKRKRSRSTKLLWEKVSILHFQSTHVMLYLYNEGDLLPFLCEVDKACKSNDKELEIVIVYLPFRLDTDPWSFINVFGTVLAKRNLSWWLAPVNFTTLNTLPWFFDYEKLVIVGPNDQFVDPRGAEVLKIYGLDYFPFTFKRVVEITVKQLRQITLESLLPLSCKDYLNSGKVVLLYFDFPSFIDSDVYNAFFRFLKKSNMLVLPFSLDSAQEVESHLMNRKGEPIPIDYSDKLKWFYCDGNVGKNFFLRFFNYEFPTIVAFGKDGRIRSVFAHSRLPSSNTGKASPIKGSLKKEVSLLVDDYYSLDVLWYLMHDSFELDLVIKAKQSVR